MNPTSRIRTLGITGPIACGKTTVGDVLLQLGAITCIDADAVVHELMQPGADLTREIAHLFGDETIAADGGVDRATLAAVVFRDAAKLEELERIVHPRVSDTIRTRLINMDRAGIEGVVVIDAVKLMQSALVGLMDAIWLVRCSRDVQLERLRSVRGMSLDAAQARLAAQPTYDESLVDAIIDNTGARQELEEHVQHAWCDLQERWRAT